MSVIAKNPILPGFYPDPSICAVGEDFYLVNSSFAYFPGLPIMHSRDLAHWEQIGNAMDRNSQLPLEKADVSQGLFAPTIRYHDGLFYIVCTNISHGGNFVITAEEPEGPWSEPHYLAGADGIDPSLFFDEDGKCYYTGTHPNKDGCRYNGDYYIYVQELDLTTFTLVGERRDIWNGAMRDCQWPEGPHLYKVDGVYYLIHAEGGTGPNHAVCVARSGEVFGPYETNFNNPIFTHRHLGKRYPIQYVGHADLVQTIEGDFYMVMLATRPVRGKTTMGRETFLARVEFEDGWPVVNPGLGILSDELVVNLPEYEPVCDYGLTPMSFKQYNFAKLQSLPFSFLTLRNPAGDLYRLDENGLNLKCERGKTSMLCIRQDSHTFEASVVLNAKELFDGALAGLILFQNTENHLRIEYAGFRATALLTQGGVETRIASEFVTDTTATLIISVSGTQAELLVGAGDLVHTLAEEVDVSRLSTEDAGGFVGCTIGMYASMDPDVPSNPAVSGDVYACFKTFSYRPFEPSAEEDGEEETTGETEA